MTEQEARLLYWRIFAAHNTGDSDWEPSGYSPLAGGGCAVVVQDRWPDSTGAARTLVLETGELWRLHRAALAAAWNRLVPADVARVEVG